MTIELKMLALLVVLVVQIVLYAQSKSMQNGYRWTAGPRDEARPPLTPLADRLERALSNFLETFPLFAAAALLTQAAGRHDWMTSGAQSFISRPAWSMCRFMPPACSWCARSSGTWRHSASF